MIGNLYCNKTVNQCQTHPSDGSCVADEVCKSNWCKDCSCEKSAEGKPCESDSDCSVSTRGADQYWLCPADKKTCHRKQRVPGESCSYNEQCTFNTCSDGKCVRPAGAIGSDCKDDSQCDSSKNLVCRYQYFSENKKQKTCFYPP